MCGIVGFLDTNKGSDEDCLRRMVSCLSHRGPDDMGVYYKQLKSITVGLGHTRLSIQDLSISGHQPMHYDHLSLVYNGEIYNFKELRIQLELEGYSFQSQSDSEVLLKAYHCWGKRCVERLIGMFAFAIFDKSLNKLLVFRDRSGVKPVYYYWKNGLFLFSSELKAFHEHSKFSATKCINSRSLSLYLLLGYVPSPDCIFEDTYKLLPGHYLELDVNLNAVLRVYKYWGAFDLVGKPRSRVSNAEAQKKIHDLLISAVKYRMISDAPIGVFLSGGYDSSLVTAIMQKNQSERVKTFTIGFDSENYNEADDARVVSSFIGTEHYETNCSDQDFHRIFKKLPDIYDEPLADDSAIPTILLSEFAKQHVDVAISADGGDELFAGYNKYLNIQAEYKKLCRFNPAIAYGSLKFLKVILKPILNKSNYLKLGKLECFFQLEKESRSIVNLLRVKSMKATMEQVNEWLVQPCNNPIVAHSSSGDNPVSEYLAADYGRNMTDAIVTKVERASMAYALEAREPLLDHRLYEFLALLPDNIRNEPGKMKSVLKGIAETYVPKELLDRPKKGFTPPLNEWASSNWFADLKGYYLSKEFLDEQGLFKQSIGESLDLLDKGTKIRFQYNIVLFQMWYERWML